MKKRKRVRTRLNSQSKYTSKSFFSSNREARLWIYIAIAIVGIYSTLLFAGTTNADVVRQDELIEVIFVFSLLLIGGAIMAQTIKKQSRESDIGIGIGMVTIFLLIMLRILSTEERNYMIEYCVIGILIYEALEERVRNGRSVPSPVLIAILATAIIGAIDEFIQLLIPKQNFSYNDMLFSAGAGAAAIILNFLFGRVRR